MSFKNFNNMKFVPGEYSPAPWNVFRYIGSDKLHIESNDVYIATIKNFINAKEDDANARLIAAAPDLLEALESYLMEDEMYELVVGCGFGGKSKGLALKAIAKAKGCNQ